MRVAVVVNELSAAAGGKFTFQSALVDAIREKRGGTEHEFLIVSRGVTRDTPGSLISVARRGAKHSLVRLVQHFRDVQDRLLGIRTLHPRTSFERWLDDHGVELVWFSTYYAEDCNRPFIFTVFDLQYLEQPWFPEVSQRGQFENRHRHYSRYLRKATRVIVPNEVGRDELMRHFAVPPNRILTLPHPTPQFALQAGAGAASDHVADRLRIESPYLLYPAQFWPHKNHVGLLQALKALDERGHSFELVLVGSDKGAAAHVQRVARELEVEGRVHLLGFVERDTLVGLYRDAHALVYLSYFGPENIPPLEAFALGCPVIYGDIPGGREQLGDAALYVSLGDARATADAVLRLHDPELRASLTEAGRRRAAARTTESYLAGVVAFLDDFEAVRQCWA